MRQREEPVLFPPTAKVSICCRGRRTRQQIDTFATGRDAKWALAASLAPWLVTKMVVTTEAGNQKGLEKSEKTPTQDQDKFESLLVLKLAELYRVK